MKDMGTGTVGKVLSAEEIGPFLHHAAADGSGGGTRTSDKRIMIPRFQHQGARSGLVRFSPTAPWVWMTGMGALQKGGKWPRAARPLLGSGGRISCLELTFSVSKTTFVVNANG